MGEGVRPRLEGERECAENSRVWEIFRKKVR